MLGLLSIGASIFSGVKSLFSSGSDSIAGKIVDEVTKRLPMTTEQKAQLEIAVKEVTHKQALEVMQMLNDTEAQFNKRIADMEGTASDLKSVPIVGHIILLLRGAQRPIWGFGVLYFDSLLFLKRFTLNPDDLSGVILVVANVLVLGFLFGERAMKNVLPILMPWIERMLDRKDEKK